MEAAGCQAQAAFNAEASIGRLVGALLYLVVAAAALALFIITAFTLVVAKGLALFLIALLAIALYAGLFPGAGRSLLWHWVAALVRVVALVVVRGVFLGLLVTGLNGLLGVAGGLWTRFLLVIFFMAVMAVGRRQLLDISSRFADSTLQRLKGGQIGGAHSATWIRPYQAGSGPRSRATRLSSPGRTGKPSKPGSTATSAATPAPPRKDATTYWPADSPAATSVAAWKAPGTTNALTTDARSPATTPPTIAIIPPRSTCGRTASSPTSTRGSASCSPMSTSNTPAPSSPTPPNLTPTSKHRNGRSETGSANSTRSSTVTAPS